LATSCTTFVNPAATAVGVDVLVSAKECVSSAKVRKRTPENLPTNAISGFGKEGKEDGGVTLEEGKTTEKKPT
jgi:hypothetical protein